ncbi:oxidoreductase [Roseobacter denitrificans]|uniref:Oxidoreductase, putative n=1 Tax=Roseobacter denitrificans (strain ATCC 33942 / OCh 114) TaxID=375451 RepID=Q16AR6_ROSDO|nr:SDR family oxidoreductase [Roseobacter denitrificans]ABG30927.1 oxidoreductase, putative [Roseobacter denitrificans OCh 114]AVL54019.1 oxidoreductase [Roseobacter denitrificans]SFG14039.1 7-alpha-hydroxysteroid dehydrogenase [Roseobacter denitrificans OCh 114]
MSFSISGKTAIVTGAANGIGLAIARQFADRGANVMCADIDERRLAEEWGDLSEDSNLRYFGGDLRQRLTIANLVSATIDSFDRVDILVNASRQVLETDALDFEDTSVSILLEQNLMTALHLTQQVAKRMIKQGVDQPEGQCGSIINLSSITARTTRPELMGYSIASAALEQMTRSMALVLAPERIRVNAIAFGSVMSASLKTSMSEHSEWRDEIRNQTPLARIAGPAELSDAVQFLAAESSSFMTGEVMTVDGGRSLLDAVAVPAH